VTSLLASAISRSRTSRSWGEHICISDRLCVLWFIIQEQNQTKVGSDLVNRLCSCWLLCNGACVIIVSQCRLLLMTKWKVVCCNYVMLMKMLLTHWLTRFVSRDATTTVQQLCSSSVCLSATHMHCVKMDKDIVKLFHHLVSHYSSFLVPDSQMIFWCLFVMIFSNI